MSLVQTNHRFALARYTPNGSLDPSFSADGMTTTAFPPILVATASGLPTDRAGNLVASAAGSIVVGGQAESGSFESKFAVARYTANGSLDVAFSNDGRVTTAFANQMSWVSDVAIDPNGRIVAGGAVGNLFSPSQFAVARYLPNGTLDTSFSGDGTLTTTFPGTASAWAQAVAVDAQGRIVLGGHVEMSEEFPADSRLALARYTTSGSLDTTFSGDGLVTTNLGAAYTRVNALAIDVQGRIVVAGSAQFGGNDRFVVARYTSAGTLDTTFSGDGCLTTAFPGAAWAQANAVAIDSNGRIVVAGMARIGNTSRFAIARYTASGALDTTFSGDGLLTMPFPGATSASAEAVAVDGSGRIVVAGSAEFGATSRFAIARYTATGALDTSFSNDGLLTTTFPAKEWASALDVALDPSGRVLVAGLAADLEDVPDPEPPK